MRRAAKIHKAEVRPDARYNNVLVTRFINSLMHQGKKSTAERIFYGAMDSIEKKTGQDGLSVLKTALNNVKPILEVKSRRVGGATYQVPVEVPSGPPHRARPALDHFVFAQQARSHDGRTARRRGRRRFQE